MEDSKRIQEYLPKRLQQAGLSTPMLKGTEQVEELYHAWPSRLVFISRSGRILWETGLDSRIEFKNPESGKGGETSHSMESIRSWLTRYLRSHS